MEDLKQDLDKVKTPEDAESYFREKLDKYQIGLSLNQGPQGQNIEARSQHRSTFLAQMDELIQTGLLDQGLVMVTLAAFVDAQVSSVNQMNYSGPVFDAEW